MDWITKLMIGGFAVIILATLWNALMNQNKNDKKSKEKKENELFLNFQNKKGFKISEDKNTCQGYIKNRQITITTNPMQTTVNLTNTKGIRLKLEQGIDSGLTDLIGVPLTNAGEIKIKSNYPQYAAQIIDEKIIEELKEVEMFTITQEQQITINYPENIEQKNLEILIQEAVKIAENTETVNYAYE